MAQTFNNGESNASIRTKLNGNAEEINDNAAAIEGKQDTLISGTNIRPVNGNSLLGSSNLVISTTVSNGDKGDVTVSNSGNTWLVPDLANKANTSALPTRVSLQVDQTNNTSDVNKPVSTAQAAAIAARVPNTRTVNGHALSADVTVTATDVGLGGFSGLTPATLPISNAAAIEFNNVNESLAGKATTDASSLTSGTLNDARLSTNVPKMVSDKIATVNLPLVDIFPLIVDAFEPGQIEIGLTGKIRIIGVTPVDQLATPVLTFGTSTSDQNTINWTRPTNGVSSELDWFNGTSWVNLYTGVALTFDHTGLAAETSYLYRVKAVADGFIDSNYAQASKSTAPESGGGNLIPDYITQDVNNQTEPGREYDESPAGVFTPIAELTDNPFRTGYKMVVGSRIALKAGSLNCLFGLCESGDSLFDEKRVFIGFNPSGVAFYGKKSAGNTTLSTQPTVDGFVVLTATSGQIFNISVYESGTYTSIADVDMGYNLLSFGGIICGTANTASTSVIMYPQGKDIELV